MLAGRYADPLVVSGAFGGRLRILGRAARVQNLRLESTRYVTVGPLKVTPLTGDALLQVSGLAEHPPAGPDRDRSRHPLVGRRRHPRLELGDRPAERVHALRRPLAELGELPEGAAGVEPRARRPRLVPRLPRLRLPPRPHRLVPDRPLEPVRAHPALQPRGHRPAASPSEPGALRVGALQAPGPDRALRGRRPALRPELLRRLQGRRRAAVRHRRVAPDADRQQRLPGDRPARAGMAVAGRRARRRKLRRPDPDVRPHRAQQDLHRRDPPGRLCRVDQHQRRLRLADPQAPNGR